MEKGSSKILIILEIYKAIILTIIAIFLFISLFDVSIEKKNPTMNIPDLPTIDVETKENGVSINVEDENRKLLIAKKNRDELSQHCSTIATDCQRYYRTPGNNGGGGLSFIGYKLDDKYTSTENGFYSIKVNSDKSVTITATGAEIGKNNTDPVRVVCTVNPVVIQMDSEN
nr:hypothetical protein [uncultured Sphaerochaeta sp.]